MPGPFKVQAASGGGTVQPVTPPSAATEVVAAGGSLADVTFGPFTDPGSRIDNYNLVKTNVSGSAAVSGSGLGPYAITGDANGEVLGLELQARDSSNNVLATAVYVGRIASDSVGEWETIKRYVFSSNVTDKTIAKGAAASNIFESDGTTPIVEVRHLNRSNTPTSVAECTAAAGRLQLSANSSGGTEAAYIWGKITETDSTIDWNDGRTYAVDFLLNGLVWGQSGDDMWIGFGTSASGISAGQNVAVRLRRTASSTWSQNSRRYFGSAVNGSAKNSSGSAPTQGVVRFIVYKGTLVEVYWQMGTTTFLEGYPTEGGSVYGEPLGVDALTLGSATEKFSADTYFYMDAQATGGTDTIIGLDEIRVQAFQ